MSRSFRKALSRARVWASSNDKARVTSATRSAPDASAILSCTGVRKMKMISHWIHRSNAAARSKLMIPSVSYC